MPVDRFLHPRASKSSKVSMLTDLEYRMWTQYLLSADDFGVMRATPLAFQNDNDHLANRKVREIQRCIDRLVACGLVRTFEHQGKPYLYQLDWQKWQKVDYPRATLQPKPPDDALVDCSPMTQQLFEMHPGGKGEKFKRRKGDVEETFPESSGNDVEKSATNARERTREVANGQRLTANGLQGSGDLPAMDVWARELVNLYPSQGRCGWNIVERPLLDVLMADPDVPPTDAWEALKARLEVNKRSYQWLVKGMIPRLDRYLRDGTHLQELPEHPVATLVTDRTAGTLAAAAAAKGIRR